MCWSKNDGAVDDANGRNDDVLASAFVHFSVILLMTRGAYVLCPTFDIHVHKIPTPCSWLTS